MAHLFGPTPLQFVDLTKEQARAAFASIPETDRCSPGCRGWDVFEANEGNKTDGVSVPGAGWFEIEACTVCTHNKPIEIGGVGRVILDDEDARLLPEAWGQLLREAAAEAAEHRIHRVHVRKSGLATETVSPDELLARAKVLDPPQPEKGGRQPHYIIAIYPCIEIGCQEWFERQDFKDFLDGRRFDQVSPPATWHRIDEQPHTYSDVFVTYDRGEGSDTEALPDDIWQAICRVAEKTGIGYAIVRITPGNTAD